MLLNITKVILNDYKVRCSRMVFTVGIHIERNRQNDRKKTAKFHCLKPGKNLKSLTLICRRGDTFYLLVFFWIRFCQLKIKFITDHLVYNLNPTAESHYNWCNKKNILESLYLVLESDIISSKRIVFTVISIS